MSAEPQTCARCGATDLEPTQTVMGVCDHKPVPDSDLRERIARVATSAHLDLVATDRTRVEIRDAGYATADAVLAVVEPLLREAERRKHQHYLNALEWRDRALPAEAEVAALRATVQRVEALHLLDTPNPELTPFCVECGHPWPCATVRALSATSAQAEPEPGGSASDPDALSDTEDGA